MSTVKVSHAHSLDNDELKTRVSEIADELGQHFKLESHWQDDSTIKFKRAGVSGTLTLSETQVDVNMKLGVMLGALKGPITKELKAQMEKRLC